MDQISLTLTKDEAQYILHSLDSYVKANGLSVASTAVVITMKLQQSVKEVKPPPKDPEA